MPFSTDPAGRSVLLPAQPQRIISLVPSQTELLYHLGLGDKVVGITKFCVHPEVWFRSKRRIGGTKNINMEAVHALNPDLILAAKEENVREQVEELSLRYPVWTSDVRCLEDAIEMIHAVGAITGTDGAATALASRIKTVFGLTTDDREEGVAARLNAHQQPVRAAYLIWNEPLMAAGGGTFIHDMMRHAGFENIFRARDRYPVVTPEEIGTHDCHVLLLSSEPYPFSEKHTAHFQQLLPQVKILLVDGEAFSWYGSRLLGSPAYFKKLHGEVRRNG